jgi:aminocarboxymuconate-semialdehyde decarboxylase
LAAVSLDDVDAALREVERAVTQLGARGVQVFTSVAGRPLDRPEYRPVFAAMAEHDLPVWLHPARTAAMPDYAAEPLRDVVVLRLALRDLGGHGPARLLRRLRPPPRAEGRHAPLRRHGAVLRRADRAGHGGAGQPHLNYFRLFYADTAMFGGRSGLLSALDFFGPDHLVFATDAPLGPIPESVAALDRLALSEAERPAVMGGTAERLLRQPPAGG